MTRAIVAIALALASTAAWAAEPNWTATETAHFIIYSKSPRAEVQKLATEVESYDKLIRMATGVRDNLPPVKVRI